MSNFMKYDTDRRQESRHPHLTEYIIGPGPYFIYFLRPSTDIRFGRVPRQENTTTAVHNKSAKKITKSFKRLDLE